MVPKLTLVSLALTSSILASTPIQSIDFKGNVKITSNTLKKITHHHIGRIADLNRTRAIENDVEAYYRHNNYALAYAKINPSDEGNGTVSVLIGKYNDFNERSLREMQRREIKSGLINQIYFVGNEKISTNRLMNLIAPSLGKTKNEANLNEIAQNVQNYYRNHRYELAYAVIKSVDEQGIVTVEIKKYPDFKALYAREGKH